MNLKLQIITIFLLFQSLLGNAQNTENENIRALKVVFITEQLELSSKEAEKFWPIYNLYSGKEFNLRIIETRKLRQQIVKSGGINAISDSEADDILKKLLNIENEITANKNEMYLKLKPIISSKKLLKLQIAEIEFNKKVLEELRKKRVERFQNKN